MDNDLKAISLAFCQECLGWDNAFHQGDGYIVARGQSRHQDRVWGPQETMDLNAVMEAVREWIDRNGGTVGLRYLERKQRYYAKVDSQGRSAPIEHANPCHALLAACVEASRALQTSKGSDL